MTDFTEQAMTTWYDLAAQEKVALVGIALSYGQQRKVIADDWQCTPYVRLCSLQLISIGRRSRSCITYTLLRKGANVLMSAPDDAEGQYIFPTADDIREMKRNLQSVATTQKRLLAIQDIRSAQPGCLPYGEIHNDST